MTTSNDQNEIAPDVIREDFIGFWMEADPRHGEQPPAGIDATAIARWEKWQLREREDRKYRFTNQAVFRGTISAMLVVAVFSALLWLLVLMILESNVLGA